MTDCCWWYNVQLLQQGSQSLGSRYWLGCLILTRFTTNVAYSGGNQYIQNYMENLLEVKNQKLKMRIST